MSALWSISPEWSGETCFIVAGGPSIETQPIERIRGRRIIAINSSWPVVPFADLLFFGDARWWEHYGKVVLDPSIGFAGRIATCEPGINHARVLKLRKVLPPGLAQDRSSAMLRRTSLTAAMNIAFHLGVTGIVLLGADGQRGSDGRSHHHAPHPWNQSPNCWDDQKKELCMLVAPLHEAGVMVINASPGSAWADLWPVMTLSQALEVVG